MTEGKNDWNAEDYAEHSAGQEEWARQLIDKIALHGHESILDLGCGDGKISAHLASLVSGSVVGIDSSASMISLARRRFSSAGHANLRFVQMDATDLRLSGEFDVAFSNAVLHWIEDHVAVLTGVRAALRPGGKLLFQMGGHGNAAGVFRVMQQVLRRPRWSRYYAGFTSPYHLYKPEDYARWLPECGFRSTRAELMAKDMQHPGLEAFTGWLRTTWFPYIDRSPAELQEELLTELVGEYTATHPPDSAGKVHVDMVRLEAEAVAV